MLFFLILFCLIVSLNTYLAVFEDQPILLFLCCLLLFHHLFDYFVSEVILVHFSLLFSAAFSRFDDFGRNLSGFGVLPITYSCFHKNMEEFLEKYQFQSEKKFQHFNQDLSAFTTHSNRSSIRFYLSHNKASAWQYFQFSQKKKPHNSHNSM